MAFFMKKMYFSDIVKRDSEIDHLEKLLKIKQDQNDTLTAVSKVTEYINMYLLV